MNEARRHDELDATLQQIDEFFAQSAAIVARGRDAFFAEDFVLRNAAVGLIIRLGEAAKNLPSGYIAEHPEVHYRGLIRMRDAVAHRYDTTDWNLVWEAISTLHPRDAEAHTRR